MLHEKQHIFVLRYAVYVYEDDYFNNTRRQLKKKKTTKKAAVETSPPVTISAYAPSTSPTIFGYNDDERRRSLYTVYPTDLSWVSFRTYKDLAKFSIDMISS